MSQLFGIRFSEESFYVVGACLVNVTTRSALATRFTSKKNTVEAPRLRLIGLPYSHTILAKRSLIPNFGAWREMTTYESYKSRTSRATADQGVIAACMCGKADLHDA